MKNRIFGVLAFIICMTWPAHSAMKTDPLAHGGWIEGVLISSKGKYVVSGQQGYTTPQPLKIWDVDKRALIHGLPDSADELPLAWSPDDKFLLSAVRNTRLAHPQPLPGIRVRSMPSGEIIRILPDVNAPLWFDGKIIRTTDGHTVEDWSALTGKLLSEHPLERSNQIKFGERAVLFFYAFSRNGKYLAFGGLSDSNDAYVWNSVSGKLLHKIHKKDAMFGLPAISNNGCYLLTQGEDPNWILPGSDDPHTEASYSRDFTEHLWDLKSSQEIHIWPGFRSLDDGAWMLKFSQDDKFIFAGGDNRAFIYDLLTGKYRKIDVWGHQNISNNDQFWVNEFNDKLRVTIIKNGKVLPISK